MIIQEPIICLSQSMLLTFLHRPETFMFVAENEQQPNAMFCSKAADAPSQALSRQSSRSMTQQHEMFWLINGCRAKQWQAALRCLLENSRRPLSSNPCDQWLLMSIDAQLEKVGPADNWHNNSRLTSWELRHHQTCTLAQFDSSRDKHQQHKKMQLFF